MERMTGEAITIALVFLVLLGGYRLLFAGRHCWGCGGSGLGPDGQMPCPRCGGRGKS